MNNAANAVAANDPLALQVRDARRLTHWGMAVLVCGLLPAAAWMSFAPLSSAVVAQAYVKVDLNRRPVQHAEGGIVREVLVRDGQRVRQGEPLLVLGDVSVDADRNRLDHRVKTERASLARLDAEQTMARAITFPPDVIETAGSDPRLAEQLAKERSLFDARRDALVGQVRLLRSQREKVAEEIVALRAQIAQASDSIKFQKSDLETNRKLLKDGFISATRIAQLEGTVADYGVKIEERRAELARAEQRTVDADLRIRSLESDYRQHASDQLKVTAARLSEIEQERRKSLDASARQVITAPASGEIIDLKYSTPGSVIPPRETIADVVPDDTRLVTDARVRTEDIGRIHRGQAADIRFTAFTYRTTQLVRGKVVYVSADRLIDRATHVPYYSVLVEADPASLATAGDLKLLAGMPAEIYVKGDERTPLQYLVEPVTQVLRRAVRER
ncbi:HlyD family type I secretion periplasmic adaptor subunit [Variovorax sp. MHTC-1]|uniref:HlyD family type I secretion periplasmic adaptor subunit n=1 Tax=Variovorax sp. MHTC-1 TaxID=2495593 RepID=UPI000F87708B|nr:HlyD family type I secretion periplasmic adaptor subunit [Variovorax sp. MHTC-1]RST55872.1 HlyD family type I secretion periplasmic adaptor subunit [Variovorax sp. MHTC-1]